MNNMDEYSVGSLADLISGKKSVTKTKIVRKAFVPVKKEPEDTFQPPAKKIKVESEAININHTGNKLKKVNSVVFKSEQKSNVSMKINKSKKAFNKTLKKKVNKSKNENASEQEGDSPKKGKKRTLDEKSGEESPKKLSKSELNAASRVKNKQNQELKNSSDYKDRTLFVGNIPITVKKQKIKKHFRKYGIIDTVRIRGIPTKDAKTSKKVAAIKKEFHPDRNTLYAFIRFQSSEACKAAEAENGVLFEDHHLRVHFCESEDKPDESKAIFVGNLAFSAEEEELWNIFKACGPISHVRIVRDGRTGMGKGFGYVNFKDSDSVQLALEMEKVMLKNRELRISLCEINRAKKLKKKPRTNVRRQNNNGDKSVPKENGAKESFSGTKFNDMKKKKKFNKGEFQKKKIAKRLVSK